MFRYFMTESKKGEMYKHKTQKKSMVLRMKDKLPENHSMKMNRMKKRMRVCIHTHTHTHTPLSFIFVLDGCG